MLITMKNSALIDNLVELADGDIDLVHQAIRASAEGPDGAADLKKVVEYIVRQRERVAA
jgi:ketosteroid isomerase-like protein